MDDRELLKGFTEEGSEEAFAELTARYVDLVYSAAARQTADPEQARDVTQAVFVILARKAKDLSSGTILSGWLYRTARFVALEAVRAETRRKRREETMAQMNLDQDTAGSDEVWRAVAPNLDEAMEGLSEPDRTAVLLRFFQGRSLREVGDAFAISEEAAKKRVSRALEKLRQILGRKGITSSSSLLSAALMAHAIQGAPAAVAGAAAAASGTAASVEILTKGALQMIAWTKAKTTVACAVALALTTATVSVGVRHAGIVTEAEAPRSSAFGQENRAPSETEIPAALAALQKENQELRQQSHELHRSRNLVAQLSARNTNARTGKSKVALQSAPPPLRDTAETLRELQFEKFLAAGRKAITLQPLKEEEQAEYVPEIVFMKNLGLALRIYASKHSDQYPEQIEQLLETDLVTDEMKEKLRQGNYEYLRFKNAETKPGLPSVWWKGPDGRGIRLLVANDGSSHLIREPADANAPGFLALGGLE